MNLASLLPHILLTRSPSPSFLCFLIISNMKIRRETEEAVPNLLNWLSKTKERVLGPPDGRNPDNPMLRQFQEIEERLQGLKDLLPKIQRYEQNFIAKFTELKNEINHDIFDGPREKTQDKLKFILEKVDSIRNLIDRIGLQSVEDEPTASQTEEPSEAQVRKASENWVSLGVEKNVLASSAMYNLKSSYEFLDLRSRLCLLCFSIFPENSVIKKRPLIYWWVSEGLVRKTSNETAHEVGEEIFRELITKGLIQPVYNRRNPLVNGCKMRPWTRRMLISVAKEAEFFDFYSMGTPATTADRDLKSHRVCLVSGSSPPGEEDVSTLFNVDEKYLNLKPEWFSNLKKLVVLQLGRWQASVVQHIEVENPDFLSSLGLQKFLKYLSLRGISRVTKLPSSLVELISLEILDLRACHNLEKLPSDISPLRRLTHLDLSECYLLEGMPKGLDNLSSLQVLKGFLIGRPWSTDCKFADLAKLTNLRKLSICIGKEASAEELDLDKLKDIQKLRILAITWERVVLPSETTMGEASSALENKGEQSGGAENSAMGGASNGSENRGEEELSATANSTAEDGSENKGEESNEVADSTMENKGEQSSGAEISTMGEASNGSENRSEEELSATANSTAEDGSENKGEESNEVADSTMENKGEQSSGAEISTMGEASNGSENRGEEELNATANSTPEDGSENKGEESNKVGVPNASDLKGAANKLIWKISEKLQSCCLSHCRAKERTSPTSESKADKPSTNSNSTTGEAEDVATLREKISFPAALEKLDLWCLPCWPDNLKPTELKKLKRLYIRGGKLESFPKWESLEWEVEILRLKYLTNLKVDLKPLREGFPKLTYLEKVQCPQIVDSETNGDFEWTKDEGIIRTSTRTSTRSSTRSRSRMG